MLSKIFQIFKTMELVLHLRAFSDAYDCKCPSFPSIFFCQHICAIQNHFIKDVETFSASQMDINCEDTFALQPTPSSTLKEAPRKSPYDAHSLTSDVEVLLAHLFSKSVHALPPQPATLFHCHLTAFLAEIDAHLSLDSIELPQKLLVAPNQHTWTKIAPLMHFQIKRKKRKHTDPYAGGEQSGKKARSDACHGPPSLSIQPQMTAPESIGTLQMLTHGTQSEHMPLLSSALSQVVLPTNNCIPGPSLHPILPIERAQTSSFPVNLKINTTTGTPFSEPEFNPATVDLNNTAYLKTLKQNKLLNKLCAHYNVPVISTNIELFKELQLQASNHLR